MATKQDWIKAGKIAAEVREWSKKLIKVDSKLSDVADKIDNKIKEKGAIPAFPVSLAINECAAHYAPIFEDPITITEEMCIKIDLGVCVNGAIGDTAYTVDLTKKYNDLVKASIEARDNAVKLVTPGVTLGEIGKTINETIQSYDYTPIVNLSGHGLGEFEVHCSPSIPNYDTKDKTELKKGMTIAIEPFATTGAGKIKNSGTANIFSQIGSKPVRDLMSRNILKEITKYNNLPFASRWLCEKFHPTKVGFALRMLKQAGNIHDYPPLVEIKNGIVTQSEHSLFVEEDGCTILTK